MGRLIDITGKKFGRLLVISRSVNAIKSCKVRWLCICDCGEKTTVAGCDLKGGTTKSCGCKRESSLITHGLSGTAEYSIWRGIIGRCYNPSDSGYKWYGALGVTVCDSWKKDFLSFLKYMGKRPTSKHSIDRINPFGNYEPGNCRWATAKQQASNRRKNWEKSKIAAMLEKP